jgi:hypothetical protein
MGRNPSEAKEERSRLHLPTLQPTATERHSFILDTLEEELD